MKSFACMLGRHDWTSSTEDFPRLPSIDVPLQEVDAASLLETVRCRFPTGPTGKRPLPSVSVERLGALRA